MTEAEKLILYNQYCILENLGLETQDYCRTVGERLCSLEPDMWCGDMDLPSLIFPEEAQLDEVKIAEAQARMGQMFPEDVPVSNHQQV